VDKYEYNLKLDQIKALSAEEGYMSAAEIADSINWNKIKNVNTLVKIGEIYEKAERYQDARDILLMAYDRSPIGRMIIYRLAEVAIKMGDYDAATEYYDEFVEIAPHDDMKYVLRYAIKKGQGASFDELITILEEYKDEEYTEEWAYELAYLYHKAGKAEERKRSKTCGNKRYGQALQKFRYIRRFKLFSYSGEHYHSYKEAYARTEGVYKTLKESVALGYIEYGNTEHGAVCCYKRKIYAKRLIKRRNIFFQGYLNKLNQSGYYKNEHYRLKIAEPVIIKKCI